MSIAENVARIRAQIAEAAIAAGRDPNEILLCAATKMNDADSVRQAIAAGVDCCGENRVQELTAKLSENAYEGAPVHFIGHLQTNKVKQVVGKVDLIQSVDSERLLTAIQKEAAKQPAGSQRRRGSQQIRFPTGRHHAHCGKIFRISEHLYQRTHGNPPNSAF